MLAAGCRPVTVLAIQHVPWEGPHRILHAFAGAEVKFVHPLAGDPLPPHDEPAGVIAMGGPMNVDDTGSHPALAAERAWLAEAVRREMPVLGVCLGAQLLARALGAGVRPGEAPELGFAPVEFLDADDPVVGGLAPSTSVLHWHGDVFELPPGAQPLASSARTAHQAFRFRNAWGLLFHAEADAALVDAWLGVPEMAEEAGRALGPDAPASLRAQARHAEADLVSRSTPGFQAFADLVLRGGGAARRPA